MEDTVNIYDIFRLMGGLAMFLYGMFVMGDALEKRAGKRLKSVLEQLTDKAVKGVLLGAGVTAVIQSSSATTVMIVGFVNSGIMHLRQAIPVVMGANIGTTITAWILSLTGIRSDSLLMSLLKPSTFSPIIAFVGIVMLMASRRRRDTASILLGFGILMFGFIPISTTYVFGTLLTANGNLKYLNIMAGCGMAFNLIFNFILIPKFEAIGSAYVSLTTQSLTSLAQVLLAVWIFKFKMNVNYLVKLLIFVLITAITGYFSYIMYQKFQIDWKLMLMVIAMTAFAAGIFTRLLDFRAFIQMLIRK